MGKKKHVAHERSVKQTELAERRFKVARLHVLGNFTHEQIAGVVGVSPQTVATDLAAIRNMWIEEAKADIAALRAREYGEVRQMEAEASLMYMETKKAAWLRLRLKIKERAAKLMGLDLPSTLRVEAELAGHGPDVLVEKLRKLSLEQLSRLIELASSAPERLLEAPDVD